MRSLLIVTAMLSAFAAHAEPKRISNGPLKPIVLEKKEKKDAVDPQAYQPKVIEAKPIELATPELELNTKDVSDTSLEKKLASRKSKASSNTNALRDPPQLKPLDDLSAPVSAAPTAAQPANKP